MIEIISGIDPINGGYKRKIWSSHKGTENFMSEIIGNGQPETVGSVVYSIHFFDKYFVFSKNKIVRDPRGADRIGTFSFSIAAEDNQIQDILSELDELAKKYENNSLNLNLSDEYKTLLILSQPDTSKKTKEVKKTPEPEKETVYLYYEDEEKLKQYFKQNSYYRKFQRIFFIGQNYKDADNDPLKSIQYDRETIFEELAKYYNPEQQKKEHKKNATFTQIRQNSIFMWIFGILLGIGGTVGYYETKQEDTVAHSKYDARQREVDNLTTTTIAEQGQEIFKLNAQINTLNDSIKNIYEKNTVTRAESRNGIGTGTGGNSENGHATSLSIEIETFLKTGCKDMTLNEINDEIKKLDKNWKKNKSLFSFACFIGVLQKNPPTQKDLHEFEQNHKKNFSDNYEYVKLFNFLKTQTNLTLLNGINSTKLSQIETSYGYTQ
jgi:hypothetical protein